MPKRNSMPRNFDSSNILLIAVIAILGFVSFKIIYPFLNTILSALLIAFIFYPLYSRIEKKTTPPVASFLTSALLLLLIAVPTYIAVTSVASEAQILYLRSKQITATGSFFTVQCAGTDIFCLASRGLDTLVADPQLNLAFRSFIGKATTYAVDTATAFVLTLPTFLLHLFVLFFVLYYAFRDSNTFIEGFKKVFPTGTTTSDTLINQLKMVINAVVWGSLIIAFLQGFSALIGFWIFGISSPFLWAMLIGIVALMPMVGAVSVWAPLGLFYVLTGVVGNDSWSLAQGIFIFAYGFFIISGIEHLLKPRIISRWGNVHPVLVILGALGGITVFGFIGVILGPLILAIGKHILQEPKVRTMFKM